MVLVQCEMQSASSRMWTRIAVSISYDDNHYTTGLGVTWGYNLWKNEVNKTPLLIYLFMTIKRR